MAVFRSYDPAIGRWTQVDPKYTYSQSVYTGMGNNPILYSDMMGDTVKVEGFEQKTVTKWLRKGLNVSKKKNPYEFGDNGEVQINEEKYDALSDEKKEVVDVMREAIEDPERTFTIRKGNDDTVIAQDENGNDVTLGDQGGMATVGDANNPNNISIWMTGRTMSSTVYMEDTGANPRDTDGRFLDISTSIGIYHELGGHGVYRYIRNDPNQKGRAIEFENKVRKFHPQMKQRGHDRAHPKPPVQN